MVHGSFRRLRSSGVECLKQSIDCHGFFEKDYMIVYEKIHGEEKQYEVIEGNHRLEAFRAKNRESWLCWVIPADCTVSAADYELLAGGSNDLKNSWTVRTTEYDQLDWLLKKVISKSYFPTNSSKKELEYEKLQADLYRVCAAFHSVEVVKKCWTSLKSLVDWDDTLHQVQHTEIMDKLWNDVDINGEKSNFTASKIDTAAFRKAKWLTKLAAVEQILKGDLSNEENVARFCYTNNVKLEFEDLKDRLNEANINMDSAKELDSIFSSPWLVTVPKNQLKQKAETIISILTQAKLLDNDLVADVMAKVPETKSKKTAGRKKLLSKDPIKDTHHQMLYDLISKHYQSKPTSWAFTPELLVLSSSRLPDPGDLSLVAKNGLVLVFIDSVKDIANILNFCSPSHWTCYVHFHLITPTDTERSDAPNHSAYSILLFHRKNATPYFAKFERNSNWKTDSVQLTQPPKYEFYREEKKSKSITKLKVAYIHPTASYHISVNDWSSFLEVFIPTPILSEDVPKRPPVIVDYMPIHGSLFAAAVNSQVIYYGWEPNPNVYKVMSSHLKSILTYTIDEEKLVKYKDTYAMYQKYLQLITAMAKDKKLAEQKPSKKTKASDTASAPPAKKHKLTDNDTDDESEEDTTPKTQYYGP